jgi:hypothetical protein
MQEIIELSGHRGKGSGGATGSGKGHNQPRMQEQTPTIPFSFSLNPFDFLSPLKCQFTMADTSEKVPSMDANFMPDFDGPRLTDWFPTLDDPNDPKDGKMFASLVPTFAQLQIRFLADLLQFNQEQILEKVGIEIGDSTFLLQKAKVAMQVAKQAAKQ